MRNYVIKRILQSVIVLLIMSGFAFALINAAPGDPAAAIYDHLTLTGPYRECLIEQDAEDEKARRSQEDSL